MADDADIASDVIDSEVSRALGRIRQNISNAQGSRICVRCDDPIPEARRSLGFKLCVPCAQESERRGSLFAG